MEFENKELCKQCGGKCCKKCGCDYYTSDFKVINKESMIKVLDSGNVSIVSAMVCDELKNKEKIITPFLYLRARNEGRGVIDLISLKRQCSMLRSDGCPYSLEERPSGGVHFIPRENRKCDRDDDLRQELLNWEEYQNLLSRMVKKYTHMSVDACYRNDVEQLFVDILNENFDGVAKEEIEDISKALPDLVSCFPEEYERARSKCLLTSKLLRRI